MSSEPKTPQRSAAHARSKPRWFALRFVLALGSALTLAACGSAPKRGAAERSVNAPKPAAPAAAPRGGGYYQDDGPGDNPPANLDQIEDAEPRLEPLHRFANNPYTVFGVNYAPFKRLTPYRQRGIGSWYGRKFHGQRTSSGESYDMYAMTAAHATLPIPSYARVTNLANDRSVIVRINDRGPFHSGRLVDLSYAAAHRLGYAQAGSAFVEVEAITREDLPVVAAKRRQTAVAAAQRPGPEQALAQGQPPATPASASALQPGAGAPAAALPVDAEAGGIYVQLGAFSGRDNADNFRVRVYLQLAWLDEAIRISPRDGMFRLQLGPYRDRDEASGVAEKIRAALQFNPLIVVR